MSATTVSFTDKELYADRPDIPITKKIRYSDVNELKAAANNHAALLDGLVVPTIPTDDYTLVLTDTYVAVNKATSVNLTVPPNSSVAFPVYKYLPVMQLGAGTVTFVAGAGVTITASSGLLTSQGVNSVVGLLKTGTNTWQLINGNTSEAVDWSTGCNPVGWASTTVKSCYYIDYGKTIFISGQITGTGTGATTCSITLPVAPHATIYATNNPVETIQAFNNATTTVGMVSIAGGNVTLSFYTSINGAAWTASQARQVRFAFTYFK